MRDNTAFFVFLLALAAILAVLVWRSSPVGEQLGPFPTRDGDAVEVAPMSEHAGETGPPTERAHCAGRAASAHDRTPMVDGVCPVCGERDPWSVPFPTISDLRAQIEVLENDVLTAWRVRNAALAVAATFIHNGPDYEDEQARKRLVEEWVGDGHDRVEEENRQRLVAIQRMIAAERTAEDLRALTLRILGHINEKGHPGQECLRSGWIPVGMVADWRSQLSANGGSFDA